MIRRRTFALALTVFAVASASLLTAAPASAAIDQTLVSLDGLTFSQAPSGSLFDPDFRAIPGDVLNGTLWVKNPANMNARLTLAVTDTSGNADLLSSLRIQYTPNEWLPVESGSSQCGEMTISRVVSPGGVTRVDLQLVVDSNLPQTTYQKGSGRFAVRAILTDASAPTVSNGVACAAPTMVTGIGTGARTTKSSSSSMAHTGVSPLFPSLFAGGAIIGGIALAATRRRSRGNAR